MSETTNQIRRIACVYAVLVLMVSVAAVAVIAPAASAGNGQGAIEKLEPELKKSLPNMLRDSPNEELQTVVFLKEGTDAVSAASAMAVQGATVTSTYNTLGAVAVSLPVKSLLGVASSDRVDLICLDGKKTVLPVPQGDFATDFATIFDPSTGIWHASTPYTMGVNKVWEKGIFGEGVRIAVLDTGADITQNDLGGAIFATKSFTSESFHDGNSHGTATAGLIAGRPVNTYFGFIKIEGMAPKSTLMVGKVLTDEGFGFDSWIIAGIEWAVDGPDGNPATPDGAQIISMSLGGLEVSNDGIDPTSLALDRATEMGVVSFVAAGNEGKGQSTIGSPGVSRTTITCGASTNNAEAMFLLGYWPFTKWNTKYYSMDYENNHMIWWSSRGPSADGRVDPDVAAVGAWGPAIAPGNTSNPQFGGTSMATPVAAGVGALVYEAYAGAHGGVGPTPAQMKAILMGTAKDMGYGPTEQGAGRIDAFKAYEAAIGEVEYSATTQVELRVNAGTSETVDVGTGVSSTKVLEPMPANSLQMSGTAKMARDEFFTFTVPAGASYTHIDLAFDPVLTYGTNVRSFTGATFTDDHLNIVLYRIDNGNRIMINYAYAHTNAQELSAKVIPGTYELRVNGAQNVNKFIPFIVKVEFYKTAEWAWAEVMGSSVKITVPIFAQAGTYAAYLVRTLGDTTSLVPVVVTVPITVGKLVKGSIDVSHDSSSIMTGDWIYYSVDIPEGSSAVTAVLAWANQDTDIDLYLINPEGNPVALSLTPTASGLFAPWRTSTGTTAQVVSEPNPEAGRWMVALHDTFLGKVFEAPYLLSVSLESPVMFGEDSVSVDGTGQATIANSLLLPMSVKLIPVTTELSTTTKDRVGTLKSIDIGGAGFSEQLIMVEPGTASIKFSISWTVPEADVSVVVYAADGSNRGILRSQGAELTVENPDPGVWDVVVMLDDIGQETDFTLSTTTVAYTHWEDLSVTPDVVMLGPLDGATIELTAASSPTVMSGMIVMYDLVTGSIYDTLPVTLVSA